MKTLRNPPAVVDSSTTLSSPAMSPFLTVREASQLTGKSPSSIRRVIYPVIHNDAHPDRNHILPSVEDALQLRVKGENFAWRLSEELLRREVRIEDAPEPAVSPPSSRQTGHADGELIAMLRRELDIKNQQITQQSELIAKQMELVSGLSERLREGNILIGSLQQRLALSDGRDKPPAEAAKPRRSAPTSSDKGSPGHAKSARPKKSLLSRLFG